MMTSDVTNNQTSRLRSVDLFRALTMLFMLFVNDSAGMKDTPQWLRHAGMEEDFLGFSDFVFPSFLFCVGMSVMLALGRSREKGKDWRDIAHHVFWRTVSLVTMGLFALNMQSLLFLSKPCFQMLMVVGFFLAWNVCPNGKVSRILTLAGAALLLFMVVGCDLYGKPFHTGWWGILGLIGWTYLVCALIYIITEGKLVPLLLAWVVVNILALIAHGNWIPEENFCRNVVLPFLPSDWGHHVLGVSGMLTIAIMQRMKGKPLAFMGIMAAMGLAFLMSGFLSHQVWIVNKIQCTPPWVYFCLAACFPLMGILHFTTDVLQKERLLFLLKPVATATLTCYTVPYVLYSLIQLTGFHYPAVFCSGWMGLMRSFVFSLVVIALVGQMKRIKLLLKV